MNNTLENSHSISDTTRKVFFRIKPPSSLFVPALITAKGLYPPSIVLLKALLDTSKPKNNMIPRKTCSLPIKLITMQEHILITTTATTTTTITTNVSPQKSQSTPPLPTTPCAEPPIIKPVSLESTPISTNKTVDTPRKRFVLKKKTKSQTSKVKEQEEEEEDEPITKPMSLTEKRKRQAKRADQIKIWKVREEREAREARLIIRRQTVNGTNKKMTQTCTTPRKKKKRVKFDFEKNSIIQLPAINDDLQDI